jgi:hypothetical protein
MLEDAAGGSKVIVLFMLFMLFMLCKFFIFANVAVMVQSLATSETIIIMI